MKKLLLLLCLLGLTGAGQTSFAQKNQKQVQKALTALLRPTRGKVASITAGLTDQQLERVIARLQAENEVLERQISTQQKLRQEVLAKSRPSVFRALGPKGSPLGFSGTIFKTNYGGKEEIFGVVPMHVLRSDEGMPGMLSYKFTAGVSTENGIQYLPAWVVQISSSKTGDIALVKFRKQDEKQLSPLSLSVQEPTFPQQAYGQGFANNLLSSHSFQFIGKTSNDVLIAQIPAAYRGERAGFCGSPVVNQKAQLAGIHVGSDYMPQDPAEKAFFTAFNLTPPPIEEGDVGYVTPVSFLEKLVTAYHQPSSKPFAVVLGGYEVARLRANEYVSRIELLDPDGHLLWKKDTDYKVSYTAAQTVLRLRPQAAYVRVYIGRSHWQKGKNGWYVENTDDVSSVLYPLPRAALTR